MESKTLDLVTESIDWTTSALADYTFPYKFGDSFEAIFITSLKQFMQGFNENMFVKELVGASQASINCGSENVSVVNTEGSKFG